MSVIDDIANWVLNDILNRPNDSALQTVTRNAALNFYRVLCAKIPFEELQFNSPEFTTIANQDTYTLGSDFVFAPTMRALASVRITFDSSNKRRLRRSHPRVYDALSITPSSRPATYARWDNLFQLNPPPDSSTYTLRFRYWGRPPIGHGFNISNAVFTAGSPNTLTFTIPANATVNGDSIIVTGVNPVNYNGGFTITSGGGTTSIVCNTTLTTTPGTYVSAGVLTDTSLTDFQNTILLTPIEWDELQKWETLYRVYYALNQPDKAAALVTPTYLPRQPGSPRKERNLDTGIIPRLWNELLSTIGQNENVDEDFNINPVIRPYSYR